MLLQSSALWDEEERVVTQENLDASVRLPVPGDIRGGAGSLATPAPWGPVELVIRMVTPVNAAIAQGMAPPQGDAFPENVRVQLWRPHW